MGDPTEVETIVLSPEGSSCDQDPDIEFISEIRTDDFPSHMVTKDVNDKDNHESPDSYPKDCLGNEDVDEVMRPNYMCHISPTQYSVQGNENVMLDENKNDTLTSNKNEFSEKNTNINSENSVSDPNYEIKVYEISDDDDEGPKQSSLLNKESKSIKNDDPNQTKNIVEQDENMNDVIIIHDENSADTIILDEIACNTGKARRQINIHKRNKYDKNVAVDVNEEISKQECYASSLSVLDLYYEDLKNEDSTCITMKSPFDTEGSHLEFPDYDDDHISCEFCSKIFDSVVDLTLHECIKKKQLEYFNNNVHKFEDPFKERCWQDSEKTFSWASDLDQDLLSYPQPIKRQRKLKPIKREQNFFTGNDNEIYNCHLCENTIRGRANLRLHVRQHRMLRDTRLYCLYCDRAFRMQKDLRKHIIVDHQRRKVNKKKYTLNLCQTILNTRDKRAKHITEHDTDVVEESSVLNKIEEKRPLGKSLDVGKLQFTKPLQSFNVKNTKDLAEGSQLPFVLTAGKSLLNVNDGNYKEIINVSPMIVQKEQMSVKNLTTKVPNIMLEEDSLDDVGFNEVNVDTSTGIDLNEIQVCDFTDMESHANIDSIEVTPLNDNNIENKAVTTNIVNLKDLPPNNEVNVDTSTGINLNEIHVCDFTDMESYANEELPPNNIVMVDFKQTSVVEETNPLDGFDLNNFIDNLDPSALPVSNEREVTEIVASHIDDNQNTLAEFDLSYLDGINDCAGDNVISGNVGHFSNISANQEMLDLLDQVESNFQNESSKVTISNQPCTMMCSDEDQSIIVNTTLSYASVKEQNLGNEINCDSQSVLTESGNTDNDRVYNNDLVKFMDKISNEIRAGVSEHLVPCFEDEDEIEFTYNKTEVSTEATASNTLAEFYSSFKADCQNTQQCEVNKQLVATPLLNEENTRQNIQQIILPAQLIASNILSAQSSTDDRNAQKVDMNQQIVAQELHDNGRTNQPFQYIILPAQHTVANNYSEPLSNIEVGEQKVKLTQINQHTVAWTVKNEPAKHVMEPVQDA